MFDYISLANLSDEYLILPVLIFSISTTLIMNPLIYNHNVVARKS